MLACHQWEAPCYYNAPAGFASLQHIIVTSPLSEVSVHCVLYSMYYSREMSLNASKMNVCLWMCICSVYVCVLAWAINDDTIFWLADYFLQRTELWAVIETSVISQGTYFSDICQVIGCDIQKQSVSGFLKRSQFFMGALKIFYEVGGIKIYIYAFGRCFFWQTLWILFKRQVLFYEWPADKVTQVKIYFD